MTCGNRKFAQLCVTSITFRQIFKTLRALHCCSRLIRHVYTYLPHFCDSVIRIKEICFNLICPFKIYCEQLKCLHVCIRTFLSISVILPEFKWSYIIEFFYLFTHDFFFIYVNTLYIKRLLE